MPAASPSPPLPGAAPSWAAAAIGAHLWDRHGRRSVDFACGAGAVLLGHADPQVEAAAAEPPSGVEALARERLCAPLGGWDARFTSGDTLALALACALARRASGRSHVLGEAEAPSLADLALRLAQGDVAAVTAQVHMLQPARAQALRALTAGAGALLVFDETCAGPRRGPGGAQATLRVQPDLTAWGRSIANGRALGAVTGEAALLRHAPQDPPADAAALAACAATLDKAAAHELDLHIAVRGAEAQAELERLIAAEGLADRIRIGGDPSWITLAFIGPDARALERRFVAQLAARRVHAPGPLAFGWRHGDAEIEALLAAVAQTLPLLAGRAEEAPARAA